MTDDTLRDELIGAIDEMTADQQRQLLKQLQQQRAVDQRQYERKPYCIDIEYKANGEEYQDFLKDISIGGARIETIEDRDDLCVGQEIYLRIPNSEHQKYVRVRAKVVRISENEIGVRFVHKE